MDFCRGMKGTETSGWSAKSVVIRNKNLSSLRAATTGAVEEDCRFEPSGAVGRKTLHFSSES